MSFDNAGNIFACNENFVTLMFGQSQEALKNKPITVLLPAFFEQTTFSLGGLSVNSSINSAKSGSTIHDVCAT